MDTDEWAAKTFAYLFNQVALLPEGQGKNYVARLLLEAPAKVQENAVEFIPLEGK